MPTATVRPDRAKKAAREMAMDGLLTRLNLLAQRHNADVHIVHRGRRWTVAVDWHDPEKGSGASGWAEGRSFTECLTHVLHQVRA